MGFYPEGSQHPGRRETSKEKRLYLDTVKESNRFVANLLRPAIAARIGEIKPAEQFSDFYETEDDQGRYVSYEWMAGRDESSRSPIEYRISVTHGEYLDFDDDMEGWQKLVRSINAHPDIYSVYGLEEGELFIDPRESSEDYDVQLFTTRELRFRHGRRPFNNVQYGFVVDDAWFRFMQTTDESSRRRSRKDMSADEQTLIAKEWEMGAALSSDDMVMVLETLEVFGLYRVERQNPVVIPNF